MLQPSQFNNDNLDKEILYLQKLIKEIELERKTIENETKIILNRCDLYVKKEKELSDMCENNLFRLYNKANNMKFKFDTIINKDNKLKLNKIQEEMQEYKIKESLLNDKLNNKEKISLLHEKYINPKKVLDKYTNSLRSGACSNYMPKKRTLNLNMNCYNEERIDEEINNLICENKQKINKLLKEL